MPKPCPPWLGTIAACRPWVTFAKRGDSVVYASCLTLAAVTDGTAGRSAIARGQLRAAAAASRRKHRDLTVDAVVAATALTLPTPLVVLTSDPEDLRLLLAGRDVWIEVI